MIDFVVHSVMMTSARAQRTLDLCSRREKTVLVCSLQTIDSSHWNRQARRRGQFASSSRRRLTFLCSTSTAMIWGCGDCENRSLIGNRGLVLKPTDMELSSSCCILLWFSIFLSNYYNPGSWSLILILPQLVLAMR